MNMRLCSVLGSYVRGANDVATEQDRVLKLQQRFAAICQTNKLTKTSASDGSDRSALIATAALKAAYLYISIYINKL